MRRKLCFLAQRDHFVSRIFDSCLPAEQCTYFFSFFYTHSLSLSLSCFAISNLKQFELNFSQIGVLWIVRNLEKILRDDAARKWTQLVVSANALFSESCDLSVRFCGEKRLKPRASISLLKSPGLFYPCVTLRFSYIIPFSFIKCWKIYFFFQTHSIDSVICLFVKSESLFSSLSKHKGSYKILWLRIIDFEFRSIFSLFLFFKK